MRLGPRARERNQARKTRAGAKGARAGAHAKRANKGPAALGEPVAG